MLLHIALDNGQEYVVSADTAKQFHGGSAITVRTSETCRVMNRVDAKGAVSISLMPLIDPNEKALEDRPYRDEFIIHTAHVATAVELNEKGPFWKHYMQRMGKIILPGNGAKAS